MLPSHKPGSLIDPGSSPWFLHHASCLCRYYNEVIKYYQSGQLHDYNRIAIAKRQIRSDADCIWPSQPETLFQKLKTTISSYYFPTKTYNFERHQFLSIHTASGNFGEPSMLRSWALPITDSSGSLLCENLSSHFSLFSSSCSDLIGIFEANVTLYTSFPEM